jgi:beta-lactamase class A
MNNHPNFTRRNFLMTAVAGSLAIVVPSVSFARAKGKPSSIADIEAKIGGRVGVFAIDTGSGKILSHRPDERFAMCSTFKWVLMAAVLEQVEHNVLSLDERIVYQQADLLEYAPVTREHLAEGMTVSELARAAIAVSDNTAANLLLAKLGGPLAVTEFARSCGDAVTRLDRNEPTLNHNDAKEARDTTSPRAMATLMRTVLCGNRLSMESRGLLLQWLRDCETGNDRLRAGLPKDWVIGDKTGTSGTGASSDVAIATPPSRAPILVTAYLSASKVAAPVLNAAHVDIGKLVAHHFA